MKIAMFLMTAFTHDVRVTKEAISLIEAGHEVTFYALKDKNTPSFEKRHQFSIYRIELKTRYLLPKNQIFFFIKYVEYITRTVFSLLNKPFDAYHAHDLETLPIAYLLGKIKKKPVIYDSHELYTEMKKHHPAARKFWLLLERLLVRKTFANIQTTDSRAEVFARRYHVKIPIVIRNCQPYREVKKNNLFREQLHIPMDKKIILYQGMIDPGRGVDILIETMNYLDNAVLILMGQGNYKNVIKKRLENNSKKKDIFILDAVPLEKLADYTASADIGVSLVQNTGLNNYLMISNKFFEYLTAGLPVVFPNFPEWKKLVPKYSVGKIVDPTKPQKVAEAINSILSNEKLYQKMADNARTMVRDFYNWELEVKKLLKIYDAIVQNKFPIETSQ